MTTYPDDSLLMLSGIQHFAFCPRQWALIHVEQQWQENLRTFEGRSLHERVDDPFFTESRGTMQVCRSLPLVSYSLGLYGVADVVEFHQAPEKTAATITLPNKKGYWLPYPVEYKRGKPKPDDRDAVQLCAQAICLEEMLGISISEGSLFYGQTRRRQIVALDASLRKRVIELSDSMHSLFELGVTPPPQKTKACQECSLVELCLPKMERTRHTVAQYIEKSLSGDQ
jgi:CRISPR-associated exonuclease Cas4